MRVHLLALPNVQTTRAYDLDGFAQLTIRFADVLHRIGATVLLYASEENEAPCDELVTVLTKQEMADLLAGTPYQYARLEADSRLFQVSNDRLAHAIAARKQPRDFICQIGGTAQQAVSVQHPELMTVEYSIGYDSSFSAYRVFESRAHQHRTYGRQGIDNGRFFDAVIPCFYEPDEFPVCPVDGYVLYVGRLTDRKGIGIACASAQAAGVPLKVIGHGDPSLVTYGAYLGALPTAERNTWMARASAVLTPTRYLEPFNQVAVEAQMCGTPVIATDWGGFTETIEQGVSGFRCHYLGEFVHAIHQAGTLDRQAIRDRAVALYSIEAVVPQYRAYFDRLALLWGDGWYANPTPSAPFLGS